MVLNAGTAMILVVQSLRKRGLMVMNGGFEQWCEYDKQGNLIHKKRSNGSEHWYD